MSIASTPDAADLLGAIVRLHGLKDAAYGNAWKKRGEVIGVMANVARKADRPENVAAGAPDTPDESNLDTAVDLFVYVVKYCAFLADQSLDVDAQLFGTTPGRGHRSDGTDHIDVLLRRYGASQGTGLPVSVASAAATDLFAELMDCFGADGFAAINVRLGIAVQLALAAWQLVLAYATSAPAAAVAFVGGAS